MGTGGKVGMYLLFGIPGLLVTGALQTEEMRANERKKPYYVEISYYEGEMMVTGFDRSDDARKYAVKRTLGMYKMNGQLNNMEAKIYETGGKLIETIISGLSEAEYNAVKEKQESSGEVTIVSSFSWRS